MCGRFTFQPTEEFYERFQVVNCLDSLLARYNIAPSQMLPVVIFHSPNQVMLIGCPWCSPRRTSRLGLIRT
jgi:putative SOS response-associated peptidase YedK